MPQVIYVDHEGEERVVDGVIGETVMETAIKNGIPGIDANCGGACACATCHVYVAKAFLEKVGSPESSEHALLDLAEDVQPNSRLSCQITLSQDLEGLRVNTPESQD